MNQKQRTALIVIIGCIAALGPFSIDMYLPGFPAIATDLNTDVAHVSLTLTSYFIGISVGQLIYGPLLDRFGRKKPLLIGLGIYAVAALACAFSPSIDWLIAMRLLLALGGCVGIVASNAIIRDRFPVHEVARAFSSILLVMGVAPIIAPTLGGMFMAHWGWRSIFIFLFAISVLLIGLIYKYLAESRGPDPSMSLKPKAVGSNFIQVLKNTDFLMYSLAGSIAMAAMFAYISGIPFILMDIYGLPEATFGWLFGMNAFGFILGSQVNRFMLKRYRVLSLTLSTSFIQVFVTLALFFGVYFLELPLVPFVALQFLVLFFLGFINPNSSALSLEPFTKNTGSASALNGSFRMGIGAVASALMGLLHDGTAVPMVGIIAGFSFVAFLLLYAGKHLSQRILHEKVEVASPASPVEARQSNKETVSSKL
jgi:DHA1 family bicyclomycin/chloramphenicol resistance-like MFS transporter